MNELQFILAEADSTDPDVIMSEPISEGSRTQTPAKDPNDIPAKPPANPLLQFLPIILIVLFMYVLLIRSPKKKQQQHKQMVGSLKRNDRIQTIGGILGTVVDIKEDEIVLKVDEASNTKIRVSSAAVSKNISQDKS